MRLPIEFERPPLIVPGQVYLNQDLDEYLVVVQNCRGEVHFRGDGLMGMSEDREFLEKYAPVDPADVDAEEADSLLLLCPGVKELKVGFFYEDEEEVLEELVA